MESKAPDNTFLLLGNMKEVEKLQHLNESGHAKGREDGDKSDIPLAIN